MRLPLRNLRVELERPLTLEGVAEKLRDVHGLRCTRSWLSRIERGTGDASPRLEAALAVVYKTSRAQISRMILSTRAARKRKEKRK